MVFDEKSIGISYVKYTEDRKSLERKLLFKRVLAEETNKIIAVFNKESGAFHLNQSILTNIGMNCFLEMLDELSEEEQLDFLQTKALEESRK